MVAKFLDHNDRELRQQRWRRQRELQQSNKFIGSLSKDVFERRTSTGSEVFSLFICLDTTKFVLLSFFSPITTIYPRVSTKPQPNAAKSPLPVDVRRSKTLLLKLLNISETTTLHVHHAFFAHFFAIVARLRNETSQFHAPALRSR